MTIRLELEKVEDTRLGIRWQEEESGCTYRLYWSDRYSDAMEYKCVYEGTDTGFTLEKATHVPHYLKVEAWRGGEKRGESGLLKTPVKKVFHEQLEKLNRGLIAIATGEGVFLGWRMFLDEVTGYTKTGMSGTDYAIYKNGQKLALVTDSTNYLDREGTLQDTYAVAAARGGKEASPCQAVSVCPNEYLEIPMQIPESGVTPAGEAYTYSANDMSVGDVDGDGEYEFFVKWDPSNAHDVTGKGYTGKCFIDCYKLSGRLLWRLDMGVNIRAGAHYTQFMVYDFDGDGKAEMSVKTAPGTCMTVYDEDGAIRSKKYITLPEEDAAEGVTHEDNYVCTAAGYYQHIVRLFQSWQDLDEVKSGQWPATLEECFSTEDAPLEKKYGYPLSRQDAEALADYFMDVYAPARSGKNELRKFEGYIYEGPEYLTMFSGEGEELETIRFPHPREDDGLRWGDYAMNRIEPCNRVDRFLSGVAYLDGERPYLIICRGYYTRTTIAAYDFFEGKHRVRFDIDSGYVPMDNPFRSGPHEAVGTDPVYGCLAGQGDHSLSAADVDGDGCQEIIYGAAVIDHDGSVLYSSWGKLPDGRDAKFGHGDAMHVAVIDPDRPGFQIFNVFEGAKAAPYGWAMRDAETGEPFFGEYAETDLGRCMIGDVDPNVRGLCVWVNEMYDCKGNRLPDSPLGTNQSIRFAADLSTQIIDGVDYIHGKHTGIVNDNTHGILLNPKGTLANNGTKGNPCLVADIFGDFREELLLRTEDSSAVRIYTSLEITPHKLFTLMHDTMYRTGIAWQNNCYNQPCYTKFYYAGDMDFSQVLPWLGAEKV
ncbi:MAG: rhamnogalacturonan lyase [Eubacterium sp.]|nr:rhamnogalacturonan lyase [Eubacterium sp.]